MSSFVRTLTSMLLVAAASYAAGARTKPASPQAASAQSAIAQIQGEHLRIEFDRSLRSRVIARFDGKEIALGPFVASETAAIGDKPRTSFALASQKQARVNDAIGAGEQLTVTGAVEGLTKEVTVTIYDEFPAMAFFDVQYRNTGAEKLAVRGWTNNAYTIAAQAKGGAPAFWSYQSGSYEKRPNWVVPLHASFRQQNYLGMNANDYGGGTPVVDVWRRDVGLAVGHVDLRPRLVSLPVAMPDAAHATVGVEYKHAAELGPGESLRTLRTFVAVHQGDYFQTLVDYRRFMLKQGMRMAAAPEQGFGPIWCAWGYGRTFKPQQVYDTLPTVKRMGFAWVTIDDGWQNNVGDWALDPKKFPHGDADMKALVDRIHQEGFRAQLWWSPMSAVPESQVWKEHSDYALRNKDGSPQKISWWNSYYLCPADHRVVEYHQALVKKILVDWGFDGLKLDGQHMNGAPACYNPAHHHERPEAAVEAVPDFFQAIYETAQAVKPGALVEFCPCGSSYSFFTMPHFNMSVASDPIGSFQVRSKAKTLKALIGDTVPFFGDHVELSDGGDDFASTVGVGGVVGTQFVLPALAEKPSKSDLTPARAVEFEKWVRIYREKMLSQGQYLGRLYDIGFDVPEAHAIRKDQTMYYAFYAKHWKGPVELRGLEDRSYSVVDYVSGKKIGTVAGSKAKLDVEFEKHLMLEVRPE
jgi:alpha-galactosidase